MSHRDVAWSARPGFTVSMAPEVARRQLRVSLGLMAGFALILAGLIASTALGSQTRAHGQAGGVVTTVKS